MSDGTWEPDGNQDNERVEGLRKHLRSEFGVEARDGEVAWSVDLLERMALALARVPDRQLLFGVTIIRDNVNDAFPDSEAETHAAASKVLDRGRDLGPPPHIHFYGRGLPHYPPFGTNLDLWGPDAHQRVVLHEVAHLHVQRVTGQALDEFVATGEALSAARGSVRAAAATITRLAAADSPPEAGWQVATALANGLTVDRAYQACEAAGEAAAAVRYPVRGSAQPNPNDMVRARVIGRARVAVLDLRGEYANLRAELASTKDQLPRAVLTMPPRLGDLCRGLVREVERFVAAITPYARAAIGYAGAHRLVESFVRRANAAGFPGGLTEYSTSAHDEWFAETYAFARLREKRFVGMAPELAEWFHAGFPGCPRGLEEHGASKLTNDEIEQRWPGSSW